VTAGMTTTTEAVPATEAMAATTAGSMAATEAMSTAAAEAVAAPAEAGGIVVPSAKDVRTATRVTRRPITARITTAGRLAETMTEAGCGRAIGLRRSGEAAPAPITRGGSRIRA
jgi:hypothetical protein